MAFLYFLTLNYIVFLRILWIILSKCSYNLTHLYNKTWIVSYLKSVSEVSTNYSDNLVSI